MSASFDSARQQLSHPPLARSRQRLQSLPQPTGWRLLGLVGMAYLILAFLWTLPAWIAPNHLIGNSGDAISYVWNTAWVPFALAHGLNPFYSHYLNAPHGMNNMWPAPTLLWILVVWPFTALVSPSFAYNLIMLIAIATTGTTAFVLFYRFCTRIWLAFIGGVMLAFGPYLSAETNAGHPDLAAVATVLLLLTCAHEALVSQRYAPARLGLAIGVLLVIQTVTSEELLCTTGLIILLSCLLTIAFFRNKLHVSWSYLLHTAIYSSPFLFIVAAYVGYQLTLPGAIRGNNANPYLSGVPLVGFFLPTNNQWLTLPAISAFSGSFWHNSSEMTAYLGIPIILFIFFALRTQIHKIHLILLVLVMVIAVLMLGPVIPIGNFNLPGPEKILLLTPFIGDLLPMRLGIFLDIFTILLFILLLPQLPIRKPHLTILVGIAILSWLPSLPVSTISTPIPPYFTHLEQPTVTSSPPTVLVLPYAANEYTDIAMLWQAESRFAFKMPEGYWVRLASGVPGNRYGPPMSWFNYSLYSVWQYGTIPHLNRYRRHLAYAYLRHKNISSVVLGPARHETQLRQYLNAILQRPDQYRQGVWWWSVS